MNIKNENFFKKFGQSGTKNLDLEKFWTHGGNAGLSRPTLLNGFFDNITSDI